MTVQVAPNDNSREYLQNPLFSRRSRIAKISRKTSCELFFFLRKQVIARSTLLGMMSFEFVLQQENGTPQASLDPNMLDVQLK